MLLDRFWAFFKKLHKEKCGTDTKRKSSVKNVIINQISLEHLANIYYSCLGILALVLHCCYGDNVEYGLLSKCFFQKSKNMAFEKRKKKCQVNNKFL